VASDLAASLESGATLPASWYVDPGILQLEREKIFAGAWEYAGPASRAPVGASTWGPLAFTNRDPDARPLDELLDGLAEAIAASGLDLGALEHRRRQEWSLQANWKIGLENYLECYHCAIAHPGFSKVIDVDPDAYELRAGGLVLSQFGPLRESAIAAGKAPYNPQGPVGQGQYHVLFPGTTINIEPGVPNLSVDSWRPASPELTAGFTDSYFAPDVSAEAAEELMAFSAQVGEEDNDLVESVQRGLASGMVPQGRLLPASEQLIRHFQRLVFDAVVG
jgi:choline monooxygenase